MSNIGRMSLLAAGDIGCEIRWPESHPHSVMCTPRVGTWWLPSEKELVRGKLAKAEVPSRGRSRDGALDGGVVDRS